MELFQVHACWQHRSQLQVSLDNETLECVSRKLSSISDPDQWCVSYCELKQIFKQAPEYPGRLSWFTPNEDYHTYNMRRSTSFYELYVITMSKS